MNFDYVDMLLRFDRLGIPDGKYAGDTSLSDVSFPLLSENIFRKKVRFSPLSNQNLLLLYDGETGLDVFNYVLPSFARFEQRFPNSGFRAHYRFFDSGLLESAFDSSKVSKTVKTVKIAENAKNGGFSEFLADLRAVVEYRLEKAREEGLAEAIFDPADLFFLNLDNPNVSAVLSSNEGTTKENLSYLLSEGKAGRVFLALVAEKMSAIPEYVFPLVSMGVFVGENQRLMEPYLKQGDFGTLVKAGENSIPDAMFFDKDTDRAGYGYLHFRRLSPKRSLEKILSDGNWENYLNFLDTLENGENDGDSRVPTDGLELSSKRAKIVSRINSEFSQSLSQILSDGVEKSETRENSEIMGENTEPTDSSNSDFLALTQRKVGFSAPVGNGENDESALKMLRPVFKGMAYPGLDSSRVGRNDETGENKTVDSDGGLSQFLEVVDSGRAGLSQMSQNLPKTNYSYIKESEIVGFTATVQYNESISEKNALLAKFEKN